MHGQLAPAVTTELMYDQMIEAGGKPGQIIYWGKPLDWRNQTLTPNPDTAADAWSGVEDGPQPQSAGAPRTPLPS